MILVTGGTGYVGSALSATLAESSPVRISVRSKASALLLKNIEAVDATLDSYFDWSNALSGISTVIHCAARVHIMREVAISPIEEFRSINVYGTLNLARQAARAGVRRFIFISSIKVNGEKTTGDQFFADDVVAPRDPYSLSKYEAEVGLRSLSRETGMEVVIIRPPLVYGPGVKANFLSIMTWVYRGIPLPLGGIKNNRRSFVFLENLVDLIVLCTHHSAAANETFLVSDNHDLSTKEFLERLGTALGRQLRLVSIPPSVIRFIARFIGKDDIATRLCDSLQVDIAKTKQLLGWVPLFSVDEGLQKTAEYFLRERV